ncbi:glutathione hydrolase 1-like [Hibiscus syriacus]|uniref:glutathione hydrolase 1-like n=1 Tax=Hibiscus syriacus TaxID=106335 RepID=UPI00192097B1|nr:glutathione hydrolase 1-like [Hibiscus syriacus]
MTLNDLNKYEVKTREPISANILGLKVLSMPPPSSRGVSMVLALNILTQYTVPSGLSGSLGTHRVIESLKHAFTVRMNLSDPEFVNVSKFVADMISPEFSKKLKKTLNDNMTFGPIHYGGRWSQVHDHGTSHISIVHDHSTSHISIVDKREKMQQQIDSLHKQKGVLIEFNVYFVIWL